MVLAGLCFRAFLRRHRVGAYAALVGALGYACCGYLVLGGPFGVLGTETLYVALLLLAWERLWQEGRWRMWAFAVALLAALGAARPLGLRLVLPRRPPRAPAVPAAPGAPAPRAALGRILVGTPPAWP